MDVRPKGTVLKSPAALNSIALLIRPLEEAEKEPPARERALHQAQVMRPIIPKDARYATTMQCNAELIVAYQ